MKSFDDFFRIIKDTVHGWLQPNEARALAEGASLAPRDGLIVEIGSYHGLSSLCLAYGSSVGNNARVYCIDPHEPDLTSHQIAYGPGDLTQWRKNVAASGLSGYLWKLDITSHQAVGIFNYKSVDLLWVDGNHHYDAVLSDLTEWLPTMRKGALVLMHDRLESGVADAIKDRPPELEIIGTCENILMLSVGRPAYHWNLRKKLEEQDVQ